MTYEEKSAIVIRQLREDRDRLLDAIDKIRAEIEHLHHHPKLVFIKNDEVVDMALEIIDINTERNRQMPHSLRAKLSGLRYKGILEDKDYERLCKALDNEDVLYKIRDEIESNMESIIGKYDSSIPKSNMPSYKIERNKVRKECISIIDKYR